MISCDESERFQNSPRIEKERWLVTFICFIWKAQIMIKLRKKWGEKAQMINGKPIWHKSTGILNQSINQLLFPAPLRRAIDSQYNS